MAVNESFDDFFILADSREGYTTKCQKILKSIPERSLL